MSIRDFGLTFEQNAIVLKQLDQLSPDISFHLICADLIAGIWGT